jgi:hypothetical protein
MKSVEFTLGSDPELMLRDINGNLVSAIGIINGTKKNPFPLEEGMAQYDNVNAEFGIDPAESEDVWVGRHGRVMRQLDELIGKDLHLSCTASADFPKSQLQCDEAKRFACDPDFDPYDVMPNVIPPSASEGTLRSCGGHIHLGTKLVGDDLDKQLEIVKVMDVFVGIPSLLLDKDPSSQRRRSLYGKAGAHRPKSYGVEYRAIGNFWLSHPSLTRLMWKLVRDSLKAYVAGHVEGINKETIRKVINAGRLDKATIAMKDFIIPLLGNDTRELMATCLQLPHSNLYESWEL